MDYGQRNNFSHRNIPRSMWSDAKSYGLSQSVVYTCNMGWMILIISIIYLTRGIDVDPGDWRWRYFGDWFGGLFISRVIFGGLEGGVEWLLCLLGRKGGTFCVVHSFMWWVMMYDAMWCDEMRCDVMRSDKVRSFWVLVFSGFLFVLGCWVMGGSSDVSTYLPTYLVYSKRNAAGNEIMEIIEMRWDEMSLVRMSARKGKDGEVFNTWDSGCFGWVNEWVWIDGLRWANLGSCLMCSLYEGGFCLSTFMMDGDLCLRMDV